MLVVRESGEFEWDPVKQTNIFMAYSNVVTGSVTLNATRFICTLLLHLMIMPEIRSGISMLEFAVYNEEDVNEKKHRFKTPHKLFYPMVIGIMKISGGMITEVLNMWMMGYAETEDDVVKDFIAFGIISTIDDIIVMVIKNLDVEKAVEGETFKY